MDGIDVIRFDELPSRGHGVLVPLRQALGVSSFGINLERWPPGSHDHPEHDESSSGQEEVYVVLAGSCTLVAGGESHPMTPGSAARVAPGVPRRLIAGPDGVEVLCVGAIPGGLYVPSGPGA